MQEDESEIALRKQKAEDEEIDIDGLIEDPSSKQVEHVRLADEDDDVAWAAEEPDDDQPDWRMKVMVEEDVEGM